MDMEVSDRKLLGFRRIDDGELFTLNEDGNTFSVQFMKQRFPNNLRMKFEIIHLKNKHFEPLYGNTKCNCDGYFNDWHSHVSDCIMINTGGKIYK